MFTYDPLLSGLLTFHGYFKSVLTLTLFGSTQRNTIRYRHLQCQSIELAPGQDC